jgi:fluoride exporter
VVTQPLIANRASAPAPPPIAMCSVTPAAYFRTMQMPTLLMAVFAGGSLGALARYHLAARVYSRFGARFPWGTLCVNTAGAFALGLLLPLLHARPELSPLRAFAAVGVSDAFTTFTTFAWEVALLVREGDGTRAGLHVVASLLFSLLALVAGFALASALPIEA